MRAPDDDPAPDTDPPPAPSAALLVEALHRVARPQDRFESARALVLDRSVRLALYIGGPDEIEAVGHALQLCRRLLGHSPELSHHRIADFRLL
ncbi:MULTISPECIES: hypothetical protein [Streptomyces]|uniref:Uncharacterized protein n=1 Tax=Streptomyces venezuelae (strain ATCC 10712 / CBS 650.69 / DSM 40230 / JCM 4526 / NBRC 13096 / PD 04745) TaxID=953739 RepID=F2R2Q3_STRVP|nr:hypothetical protein [Streptomyces venezuelae]APE23820.1 hypothetical protein vnz_24190 [Streptomyces venezuelae]CCA58178.1 hypothetical protein SVEN_4892 [Streptomyces venezuelae ATCC 10712]